MNCDLHIHSFYSDGTCSPKEIISAAKALGLTIALTDHNTVAGVPEFLAEATRQGVTAVAGVELSTEYHGKELHLLGLFLPEEQLDSVTQLVEAFYIQKEQSNLALVKKLNEAGYAIDYEVVKRRNATAQVNRAHIAAELMRLGYVPSIKAAFRELLGESKGFYTPPQRVKIEDAIRFLRKIHAAPVLAHPLLDLSEDALRQLLPSAIEAGLLGMEVQHSSYDDAKIALATQIAAEFHLLPSGGSDFHGDTKPDVRLGVGKGNLSIPMEYYYGLQRSCEK